MKQTESILSMCTSGGCGAKIGPADLTALLSGLQRIPDKNLLVGFDSSDDAAVYDLQNGSSLISTVDFFSPMVEDARTFGRIAAANAMSDVWAMGGRPVLALNMVCFPERMNKAILGEILAGGAEKIAEAGAVLGGGHSIYDTEPKYGLAVSGLIPTDRILRNNTARISDRLILTKPLGVGLIMAALRGEVAAPEAVNAAIKSMERLNKYAAEKMLPYQVSACTDVTGFGLLAHALEMAGAETTLCLHPEALPILDYAAEYAAEYLMTAAGQRNRMHLSGHCDVSALPFPLQEILFDPQTSGGLLIAVHPEEAEALLQDIQLDDPAAAMIGTVLARGELPLIFK